MTIETHKALEYARDALTPMAEAADYYSTGVHRKVAPDALPCGPALLVGHLREAKTAVAIINAALAAAASLEAKLIEAQRLFEETNAELTAVVSWAAAADGEPDLLLTSWRAADIRREAAEDLAAAYRAKLETPTPEMIAVAWKAFRRDRMGHLGPGPGFAEAIRAADLTALRALEAQLKTCAGASSGGGASCWVD